MSSLYAKLLRSMDPTAALETVERMARDGWYRWGPSELITPDELAVALRHDDFGERDA